MNRSRRRASRGLFVVLAVAVGIAAVGVYHKRSSLSHSPRPSLSAVDVSVSPDAAGHSSQSSTPDQPGAMTSPAMAQTPPPIETSTPTSLIAPSSLIAASSGQSAPDANSSNQASLASSAMAASATVSPASRPAEITAVQHGGESWSKLLASGSADQSPAATASVPATQPFVTGNGPLADARAGIAAGALLEARDRLNAALQSGSLNDADAATAMSLMSDINQTIVFSPKAFVNDPYTASLLVHPGDSLAKIAVAHATTWELLSRINHLDPKRLRAGSTIKVIRGPFFAVVKKAAFSMDVYLGGMPGEKGSMYVTTFPVGLGKDDSTPTGTWAIGAHAKLKHPTYFPPQGGTPIDADDPKNPLGGFWIALTGIDGQAVGRTSYGIHGTIDPDSIGKQASLGCIRLKNADIAMVFDLMVETKSSVLVK